MATTTYNDPVAYNTSRRYDGVYTATTSTDQPAIGFTRRRTQPAPLPKRYTTATRLAAYRWVIEVDVTVPNEDELVVLDLL